MNANNQTSTGTRSFRVSNNSSSSSAMQYVQIEQGQLNGRNDLFLKYKVIQSSTGNDLSMKEWAEALHNDYDSFNTLLSSCPFDAFFWECSPTIDGSNRMDFVLVDAPALAQFARTAPDRHAFRAHFPSGDPEVATFPSLGKDALLLAPNTQSAQPFTDFAYFARRATALQQKAMYQRLSQVLQERISASYRTPLWLSTSGMGISWLHIRFDSRPKYYTYKPYKVM